MIARGGRDDFQWGNIFQFAPVQADRIVNDGDTVEAGGAVMTARITPGHTKGCTTWTTRVEDGGHRYNVVFICSTSAPGYKLVNNAKYPNIVEDFRHTFARLKTFPCDVMLGAHGSIFGLTKKREILATHPAANPFVDPTACLNYVAQSQAEFEKQLKRQQ